MREAQCEQLLEVRAPLFQTLAMLLNDQQASSFSFNKPNKNLRQDKKAQRSSFSLAEPLAVCFRDVGVHHTSGDETRECPLRQTLSIPNVLPPARWFTQHVTQRGSPEIKLLYSHLIFISLSSSDITSKSSGLSRIALLLEVMAFLSWTFSFSS